ncbi:MAG: ribonuclease HII [Myxococcales bacterium]|nr:ribonuclease HII [Myxococcales bacterium]MCB9534228.1 ribonuclease HII [Myxococcales bacterium]
MELCRRGTPLVVGVDEVGRGPLAGPVTVAAIAITPCAVEWMRGLDDSKRLTEAAREAWVPTVRSSALAAVVVDVGVAEIDALNILAASLEGMRRAVAALCEQLGLGRDVLVLVDGNKPIPGFAGNQRCLVRGDSRSLAIAGASVLAKVHRDSLMTELEQRYPGYGLGRHKGYPTRAHIEALERLGPTPEHRRSFAPVRDAYARRSNTR